MVDLSIIIVNYKTEEHILSCIDSINDNSGIINYEIIVVDNCNNNNPFEEKLRVFSNVRYYGLNSNYGFGYACNRGVEKSNADIIFFLNPDIIVSGLSVDNLYKTLKSKNDIAVCGGLLRDENNNPNISYNKFPNIIWEIRESFGINISKEINRMQNNQNVLNNSKIDVDWISGADVIVKKSIFEKVGGFDENIFLYYEDVDLQTRIKKAGYKIMCVTDAIFLHYERSSVSKEEVHYTYFYNMHKSKLYYFSKYKSGLYIISIRFIWITGTIFKIIALPFRYKRVNDLFNKFREYLIILKVHIGILK